MVSEGGVFIRTEAKRRGIDPEIAATVARMEGGEDAPGLVGRFDTGWSFWQYQLHYSMAGTPGVTKPTVGMGEGFTERTGWQPGDPAAWRDAARYALDHAKAYGWGAWYGAKAAGIVGMRGIDVNYPWSGTPADEWDYLKRGQPMVVPYNPDAPIDIQPDNWSCSIQAVQWLLRSIGRNPDASDPQGDPWLRSQLVPALVTPELGLLDGSGRQLAEWITREYGAEMLFTAQWGDPVTFDDVWAGAGENPTIVGGRGFNHWVGIRRRNGDGTLALANPAPGWKNVGDWINRSQWASLGPFSAVYVDRLAMLGQSPVIVPPDPPIIVPPADTRMERARALLVQALAVLDEPAPA